MDNKIIEMRQKLLNKFSLSLFKFPFLKDSDEIKIFLKEDIQDLKKELGKLNEQNTLDLLNKYKISFTDYVENYDIQVGRHKINEFQNFLKKALLNIRVNLNLLKYLFINFY
jgi:hypothetical protein